MTLSKSIVWRILSATLTVAVILVSAIAAITWWPEPDASDATAQETWTCSMHPQIRRSGPGQCPICGMNLIPVSQLSAEKERLAAIGVETEQIAYRQLAKQLRTVGKLDYSESHISYITARIDGRIDRVFADVVGTEVKQDDHLVEIFSPKLNLDQSSLIQALEEYERARDRKALVALDANRDRLRLLGVMPRQIEEIERTRKPSDQLTLYAPIGGTIIEKNVRPGQYVSQGDMLYRIAGLDPIWLFLDIYESDLAWIRYGQQADVRLEAYPGEVFRGTVSFIDPFLNDRTRTVKVRVTLKNEDHRLKPAMYASAVSNVTLGPDGKPMRTGLEGKFICPMHPDVVKDAAGKCPVCGMELIRVPHATFGGSLATSRTATESPSSAHVHATHADHGSPDAAPQAAADKPSDGATPQSVAGVLAVRATAVLDTGKRQVVYRKNQVGAFDLVEVQLGPRAMAQFSDNQRDDFFPVTGGLAEGDEVVVRGAFLLDSRRQIEGMASLLYGEGRPTANLHAGHESSSPPAAPAEGQGHQH
jgi:Cu(I)/Ag(I) efflux system membrane fusion protein